MKYEFKQQAIYGLPQVAATGLNPELVKVVINKIVLSKHGGDHGECVRCLSAPFPSAVTD
jgi:hypothetical protein